MVARVSKRRAQGAGPTPAISVSRGNPASSRLTDDDDPIGEEGCELSMDYSTVYEEQRGFLWGYCYRLSGDAAQAEDLVQDTFVRVLQSPPPDTSRPWRPWLVRVATNLARDEARREKRGKYVGPWLPSPVLTDSDSRLSASVEPEVAGRYELKESASIAFLLALEALTPSQRSVLLLRDVYDYSVLETAEILDLSEANVKTSLHRARKALETYDAERVPMDAQRVQRTGEVLEKMLKCLAAKDIVGLEAILAANVESLSDGNGRFYAAKVPVVGASKVALMYSKISPEPGESVNIQPAMLNFLPALVLERENAPEGWARRSTVSIDLDREGKVASIYTVVAPAKLAAIGARRSL